MKKKRLGAISLLFVLSLSLGACDDLEDLLPSGTGGDTSEDTSGEGSEDTGSGGSIDTSSDGDSQNNPGGSDPEITYALSITNKDSLLSLAYDENNPTSKQYSLEVSLITYADAVETHRDSISEGVEVTSSNTGVVTVSGLTLTLGSISGESTITASYAYEGDNYSDSFTLSYTYTALFEHTYEYELSITNEGEKPVEWKYGSDTTWTLSVALITTTDGVKGEPESVTASDVSVNIVDSSGLASSVVTASGLTLTATGVGSAYVIVTHNETGASAYTEVTVEEDYEYTYTLKILTKAPTENLVEGDTLQVSVSLTMKTTAKSTLEESSITVDPIYSGEGQNVKLEVSGEGTAAFDGNTLIAQGAGSILITAVWVGHESEASDVLELTIEAATDPIYSLTINNKVALQSTWWTVDGDRSLELSLTCTKDETAEVPAITDLLSSNELVIESSNSNVATIDGLKIVPVGNSGTSTITVKWTEHTTAYDSVDITIGVHSYAIEIQGKDTLSGDWSIEEGNRVIPGFSITTDGVTVDATSSDDISVTSSSESVAVGQDGLTLSPVSTGEATITATWTDPEGNKHSDSFSVIVNDNIAVYEVKLDKTSITLDMESNTSETITASVLGKDGTNATNQNVNWEVIDDSGVSMTYSGLTATVTATDYNHDATIVVTTEEGGLTASCSVHVNAEPAVAASYISSQYDLIIMNPSNIDLNGVYVLGINPDHHNFTYIDCSSTGFITSEVTYESASAVRYVLIEDEYYLEVGEQYITLDGDNLTLSDSGTPITLGESGEIGIGEYYIGLKEGNVELSSSPETYVHLLDMEYVDDEYEITDSEDIEETLYFGVHYGGTYYYYTGTATSKRGDLTTDISSAVAITLKNHGGNEYSLSYELNNTTCYISYSANSVTNTAGFATSTTETYIYWNESGYWYNGDDNRYYGLFTSNDGNTHSIGTYAYSSSIISSNPAFELMTEPEEEHNPSLKGVMVSAGAYTVSLGNSMSLSVKCYPTCINTVTGSWTISGDCSEGCSIDDNRFTAGDSTGIVSITFTTSEGLSHSIEVSIEEVEEVFTTYTYTFSGSGDNAVAGDWTGSGNPEFKEDTNLDIGEILLTGTKGTNYPKYYSDAIRVYKTSGTNIGSLTFTSKTYRMTHIVVNFGSSGKESDSTIASCLSNVTNVSVTSTTKVEGDLIDPTLPVTYTNNSSNTVYISEITVTLSNFSI